MTRSSEAAKALTKLFNRDVVQDLEALFNALGTTSRMTVFRRLKAVGYLSSYTHAGRYYTLAGLPEFDDNGLWLHQGVGFSQAGTLKQTVAVLVHESDAGCTHSELESRLRVRVHNALLGLVRGQYIVRERVGGHGGYPCPTHFHPSHPGGYVPSFSRDLRVYTGVEGWGPEQPPPRAVCELTTAPPAG